MEAVPVAEQVAGFVVIVGTAGVVNCGSIKKAELGAEVQLPLPAVTV